MNEIRMKVEGNFKQIRELEEKINHLCNDIGVKLKHMDIDYGDDNMSESISYE